MSDSGFIPHFGTGWVVFGVSEVRMKSDFAWNAYDLGLSQDQLQGSVAVTWYT